MMRLEVAHNREIFGYLILEQGKPAQWESANTPLARFFENSNPGEMPNTLKFLEPEGWLADILQINGSSQNPDRQNEYFKSGIRFLSNITIAENTDRFDHYEKDEIFEKLAPLTDEQGVFIGVYEGPTAPNYNPKFAEQLANDWENSFMPKFSGAQAKLPMSIYSWSDYISKKETRITTATTMPFSHILKMPREGFYESFGVVEWMGLELSERAGLETAKHALLDMPEGMAPGLIVERFDIYDACDDEHRHKHMRIADFCNVTGLAPSLHKYGTDMDLCFQALAKVSSNPDEDTRLLFKRIALSYFTCDNDMHMKNLSVIKIFDPDTGEINVRLSPVYDVITTAIYPELDEHKQFALNFTPSVDEYTLGSFEDPISRPIESEDDLIQIAIRAGIPEEEAEQILDEMGTSIATNAIKIAKNPPDIVKNHPLCLKALRCAVTEITARVGDKPEIPLWDDFDWPDADQKPLSCNFMTRTPPLTP